MKRLINVSDIDLECIVVKTPVKIGINQSNGNPIYKSEIWYCPVNEKPFQLVIQTPKLKIKYGAKRYTDTSNYVYCVSSYNYDLDNDISDFFNFVRKLDKKICSLYQQCRKKVWEFTHSVNKYNYSQRRNKSHRKTNDDKYIQIKIIDDDVSTKINFNNGSAASPTDIKYGCFTDQYVTPSHLFYNDNGITLIWYAHQIVISATEHIFLDQCLLKTLTPALASAPAPPLPPLPPSSRPSPPSLKPLKPRTIQTGLVISAKQLQERMKEIKLKAAQRNNIP